MSESHIYQSAKTLQDTASQHRRHIHRNPELAFQELQTAEYAAKELGALGFEVKRGFGKTGLVASMAALSNGPRFLLRFDMDALAVQEQTGLDFASTKAGLMHACGHDGHVAIGLTVAKILSELKGELNGCYYLLFQPAEEIGQGAAAMIADGVLDFIQPDYALAVHLWGEEPAGWLGITPGPVMAGCKDVSIRVRGVGGHGGRPQKAVDSILASAHLITALQSIVSRKLDPLDSGVYSITQIHAGTNNNVIPDSVFMSGKPRFFTTAAEEVIVTSTKRISEGGLRKRLVVKSRSSLGRVFRRQSMTQRFARLVTRRLRRSILSLRLVKISNSWGQRTCHYSCRWFLAQYSLWGREKKSQENAFLCTTLALILMKAALLLRLHFFWRLASNWRNQPDGT